MGRGSDERMNVERTTDRAMIDGVTYFFFFFLTVMVDGNYLWISRIDIVYPASKLYLLVLIFWRIGFRCRRFHLELNLFLRFNRLLSSTGERESFNTLIVYRSIQLEVRK